MYFALLLATRRIFSIYKDDGFVKSLKSFFGVIPAKAGIQYFQIVLDACLRRHDGILDFLRVCQSWWIRKKSEFRYLFIVTHWIYTPWNFVFVIFAPFCGHVPLETHLKIIWRPVAKIWQCCVYFNFPGRSKVSDFQQIIKYGVMARILPDNALGSVLTSAMAYS